VVDELIQALEEHREFVFGAGGKAGSGDAGEGGRG